MGKLFIIVKMATNLSEVIAIRFAIQQSSQKDLSSVYCV